MSNKIKLSTFPTNRAEALTMLYLERQDLEKLSPHELVEKYLRVEEEIKTSFKEIRKASIT